MLINTRHAYCREIPRELEIACNPAVRLHRNGKDSLEVQVRNTGPITDNGEGVSRAMIAGTTLNREQAEQLRDSLTAWLACGDEDKWQEVNRDRRNLEACRKLAEAAFGA